MNHIHWGRIMGVAGLIAGLALSATPAASTTSAVSATSVAAQAGTATAGSAPSWRVVAHRGGNVWGPESTLAAFSHLIAVKSDAVEFDVNFTKAGVPVVLRARGPAGDHLTTPRTAAEQPVTDGR